MYGMDSEKEKLKREFKMRIYKYVISLLRFLSKLLYEAVLHEIRKQVTKSGTSIGANYFEAASSKKDYQNYFSISLKSGNETRF